MDSSTETIPRKRCARCRYEFPATTEFFYRHKGFPLGLDTRCKNCFGLPQKTDEERFWDRVDKSGGPDACWPWKGHVNEDGYAYVKHGKYRGERTNRVAFILTKGPLADDLCACHTCDNPPCCNPKHLFAGSHLENMEDKHRKGRDNIGAAREAATKLPLDQARELAEMYATGAYTYKEVGLMFGVGISQAARIAKGQRKGLQTHAEDVP